MRPIGGWLFGRIADKHGRKKIDAIIGVYDVSAHWLSPVCQLLKQSAPAPALLLLLVYSRLSVGGEYGTSATHMSEVAAEGQRFYASFQYVTLIGGQLLAGSTGCGFTTHHGRRCTREWGWRIPFALGLC